MRITTWNINSIRLRLDLVERLTDEIQPDILCLQETKVMDELFPHDALAKLGYAHRMVRGQKSYNGVAILSRLAFTDQGSRDWCRKQDCRHVFATVAGGVEIHNFYVPAGGDVADAKQNDKFAHKLRFLKEAAKWWRDRQDSGAKRVMVGDLNIAPLATDVWSHRQMQNVVSHTEIEIKHLDRLAKAGPWTDAVRHFIDPQEKLYSWWSYRSADWTVNDRGRRLDHIWVTPALEGALKGASVLREGRGWPRPSDHVPVTVELAI